jgi:polysaccharide export outer membrane protein
MKATDVPRAVEPAACILLDGSSSQYREARHTMTNKQVVSMAGAACLVLALDGCATRSAPVPDTNRMSAAPQAPGQPAVSQDAVSQSQAAASQDTRVHKLWMERSGAAESAFCLGPGDLLEITVPRVDEIQGMHARISPVGTITLPHVGTIQAAGLTEAQLSERLKQRLGQTLLRDPQVSLFVSEHVSQQVSVTGAVARPGLIGLTRQTRTVADLLSEAGGMNEHSGGTVQFYPAGGGRACSGASQSPPITTGAAAGGSPIVIDLNRQWQPPNENPLNLPVVGGDALVVNVGRYYVDGWVKTPGAYDISPGTTALGGITAAGGAMYPADLHSIVVWRTEPGGKKKRIDVDVDGVRKAQAQDLTLQAGDVVSVPASTAKMVPYSGYWFLTNVVRVGAGLSFAAF